MPVRWTIENDHLLLLKLLETNPNLTVDGKKIAAAWPKDRGEVPTPRAITEHIITIRKKATDGSPSKATTPRGRKSANANPGNVSAATTSTKRRRSTAKGPKNVKFESVSSDDNGLVDTSADDYDDDDDDDEEASSPSKRPRVKPVVRHQRYTIGEDSEDLGDAENGAARRFSGVVV
ncbi:MAG: hypothetical protein M1839_009207 [Geoglossum umbratile]|nr:MAG: hypothetical protein M1839_009207 [Geoglossum umbratile]